MVLEAVKQDGYALEYASAALKDDREIVLEAVKNGMPWDAPRRAEGRPRDRAGGRQAKRECCSTPGRAEGRPRVHARRPGRTGMRRIGPRSR